MDYVQHVNSLDEWVFAGEKLGKNGLVALSWQVLPQDKAQQLAPQIDKAVVTDVHNDAFVDGKHIPQEVTEAAFAIASICRRFPLDPTKKLHRKPALFGRKYDITGLHVDVAKQDGESKSPPLNSLYVASGAIKAYFRSVPLDFIHPKSSDPDSIIDYLEKWDEPSSVTDNGRTIRTEELGNFVCEIAGAGTILAFPNAGSYERGIQPTAHQIESLRTSYPRETIAISDVHFRKKLI